MKINLEFYFVENVIWFFLFLFHISTGKSTDGHQLIGIKLFFLLRRRYFGVVHDHFCIYFYVFVHA